MTRGQIRDRLRRRLQDPLTNADGIVIDKLRWSDEELNLHINSGILDVQTDVLLVDPFAFMSVDTFDIVAGQERYDKPPGFMYEHTIAIADDASLFPGGWRPLGQDSFTATRLRLPSSIVKYSLMGRWIHLSPIPTVSVNEGLLIIWAYSLEIPIESDNDDDVPEIVLNLHPAIADRALMSALADTSETTAYTNAEARAKKYTDKIPLWYRRTRATQKLGIQPALRQATLQRRNNLPRDVYRTNG